MLKRFDVYRCEICGNLVEAVEDNGGAALMCCGTAMSLLIAGKTDGAKEKHVPSVEKQGNGYLIKVGAITHPMTAEHYISWIELITNQGVVYKKYLKPTDKPEAFFDNITDEHFTVREYCNLHGLWEVKI